jgi:hypothetical protein
MQAVKQEKPDRMQQLREGTSTFAYVLGAITIIPFWFAFWMWFFIGE